MCVQGTRPEYRKRILFIGAGNHTLQTPDTDEHVDPGRSKQKMKKKLRTPCFLLYGKGAYISPMVLRQRCYKNRAYQQKVRSEHIGMWYSKRNANRKQGPSSTYREVYDQTAELRRLFLNYLRGVNLPSSLGIFLVENTNPNVNKQLQDLCLPPYCSLWPTSYQSSIAMCMFWCPVMRCFLRNLH